MKPCELVKKVASLPFKPRFYLVLLIGAIVTLLNKPALTEYSRATVMWLRGSANERFDPQILERPEKELDLIQAINKDVRPRLRRAHILIRKQQAEIEYMKEKCLFLEHHVPRDKEETRSPGEIFTQLAAAIEAGTISKDEREFFNSIGGQTYVALHNRIRTSEESLQRLFGLGERVDFLQDRLEERRLATLEYCPERIPSSEDRRVVIREIEEAKDLLEGVHETLFKTVYTLSPEALEQTRPMMMTRTHNYDN